ncbi:MAG TPA: ABC transporter permease [Anaerolineales bacterium]|nr:ABC transporter permease [Anaerolineales bacterium]
MTRTDSRSPAARSSSPSSHSLWWFGLPAGVLLLLWGAPLLALLLRGAAPSVFAYLQDPMVQHALRLSLLTSGATAALAVLCGTPLAYALARWDFPGRRAVEALIDLTLVLPPAVAGIALLMAFGRRGLFGPTLGIVGISLPFTVAAVVMAQLFVAAPFFVRAARLAFESIGPQMEEAAAILGASPWQQFRFIMLPAARRGLLAGLALCWTRALSEFGATILFAGNMPGRTQTMPLAIYLGLERNLDVALALSVILLGVSAILLFALRRFEREPMLA